MATLKRESTMAVYCLWGVVTYHVYILSTDANKIKTKAKMK